LPGGRNTISRTASQALTVGGYCKSTPYKHNMARQIIFLALLILSHSANGQKIKNNLAKTPPDIPTKKEMDAEERNHNCIKRINRTFTTRLKNYPFNISSQIQFVSFKEKIDTLKYGDSIIVYKNTLGSSLPRNNDSICYSKLFEVRNLTLPEIDRLTDLFYNYVFSGQTFTISEANCYNPRNAILFLNDKGKAFEYIEICFECQKTEQSSEKISLGDMCDQKMDMLKELFKKVGVIYGITE
jgi:type VI protein secretion system component Hcp